jgi:hypothetical protein
MWLHTYELKAHNFLSDFVPKELIYIETNNSKYEADLTVALCMLCTSDSDMKKRLVCYVHRMVSKG